MLPILPPIPPINVIIQEVVTQQEFIVIEQINGYRIEQGLSRAEISPETCKFALERLDDVQIDWSHDGFYKKAKGIWYENLGKNATENNIFNAWLNSPSHKKNILKPIKHLCIKTINNFWVMEGKR